MKKIIIATDTWLPHIDGVVRSIEELKKQLEARGFEVMILHPGIFMNIPLFFYTDYRICFFAKRKIINFIKEKKPDYIHIATWGTVGMAARSACIESKLKFSMSYPTHFPQYAKKYIFNSVFVYDIAYKYLKWFHNAATINMVSTKSLKEESENHGFKNVKLWPLGVDVEFFKEDANFNYGNQDFKKPIFLYFGRIAKEKNIDDFLKLDLPGTKIAIGDGPQKKYFEKKYPSCVFPGWKKGRDLVGWISLADVCIFPSKTDTFGLTIIEALSCGVPVAAYNVMGPKDILTNGKDGFAGDDLQEAALECLKIDRKNCRQTALQYSWEKSAEIFINNIVKTA